MLPAANTSSAMGIGFPDVCLTPPVPVPIPYVNMAMCAEAEDTAETVLITCLPGVTIGSIVPSTEGDEAGSASVNSGEGMFMVGVPTVLLEGMPAVNLTTPTLQNDGIAPGAVLVPAVTNVFYTFAAAPADPEALLDDLRGAAATAGSLRSTVAHVELSLFTAATVAEVRMLLERHPIDRPVVVDLRGCRGGELEAALELAGSVLPAGTVLARVLHAGGDDDVRTARGARPAPHPLVVLVDRRTASAAEVFAGCLQTNDRALVVGERTFGKGAVQALVPAPGGRGGAVLATIGVCARPDGAPIEGVGITPDVEVDGDALEPALAAARALAAPLR